MPEYFSTLVSTAKKNPQRLFWLFVLVHLSFWTALSSLTSHNAPLDVIEGYAWGHDWPLGTYKHPPMQAWILQILATITDRAPFAHFLASQLAVVTAFWAVWKTGRRIMDDTSALIGVLLLEGIIYYNFTSPEFNPNLLQLPFWALIGNFFHRAIRNNKPLDWLLVGVWSAAGLYSKYSTGLLLICLALFLVMHPKTRQHLKTYAPYIAPVVCLLLFLPHLIWLSDHNYLPFDYATNQLTQPENKRFFIPGYVLSPLFLLSGQFIALGVFALLLLIMSGRKADPSEYPVSRLDKDFLKAITFGPFLLTLLMAIFLGFRVHDMWCTPFWNFAGLWALATFKPALSRETMTRFAMAWTLVFASGLLIYTGSNILYPYITEKSQRINFPGHKLAMYIDSGWHNQYDKPLSYIIGDPWPAGNVAYYGIDWPQVFFHADPKINPSINSTDIAQKGGVIIWCVKNCSGRSNITYQASIPEYVSTQYAKAQIQEPVTIPRLTGADVPPVVIGWAILPPVEKTSAVNTEKTVLK